jgi:hypothetical protein
MYFFFFLFNSLIFYRQESSTNADRLSKINEKKTNLEQQIKDFDKDMKSLAQDLRQIENDQINRRSIERDLLDQIKYHELSSEIEDLDSMLNTQYEYSRRYNPDEVREQLDKMKKYESELIDRVSKKEI